MKMSQGAICLVSLAAGAAVAQTMPPRMDNSAYAKAASFFTNDLRPDRDTPDSFRIYDRMILFGKCMAGPGRKMIEAALNAPIGSATERRNIVDAQTRLSACTYAGMLGVPTLIRGSLSEGLYIRSAKVVPEPRWNKDDAAYATFTRDAATQRAALSGEDALIMEATDCLAGRQPALADAVLRRKHGSGAESLALDTLFASTPDCGGGKRPEHMSRTYLRAFLANSVYRAFAWRRAHQAQS